MLASKNLAGIAILAILLLQSCIYFNNFNYYPHQSCLSAAVIDQISYKLLISCARTVDVMFAFVYVCFCIVLIVWLACMLACVHVE